MYMASIRFVLVFIYVSYMSIIWKSLRSKSSILSYIAVISFN